MVSYLSVDPPPTAFPLAVNRKLTNSSQAEASFAPEPNCDSECSISTSVNPLNGKANCRLKAIEELSIPGCKVNGEDAWRRLNRNEADLTLKP